MIRRLEIENFYSIRETQIIDLTVGAGVPEEKGRYGHLRDNSGLRVPRTVAFFGANASGKSNVLRALGFLQWFLQVSPNLPPEIPLPLSRFFDANADPVRVKVHFDWFVDLTAAKATPHGEGAFAEYSYEMKFGGGADQRLSVLSEELRLLPKEGKSRRVFHRKEDGQVIGSANFPITGLSHILDKLRPTVSFLPTIAQFADHAPTLGFLGWAKSLASNILMEKTALDEQTLFRYYAERSHLMEALARTLNRVDIGIRSVAMMQTSNGLLPLFEHSGLNRPLPFLLESEGTRQFLHMFPHIWESLQAGAIAVLDEADSTIHPMLLPEILRWFYDPELNPRQAQLWISGHSASLLEELRKEEVYFTEKDDHGRTTVYGLKDIEGVRRVDNFYQKYLGGVYGAVPRIG